jgi:hypothetical protein
VAAAQGHVGARETGTPRLMIDDGVGRYVGLAPWTKRDRRGGPARGLACADRSPAGTTAQSLTGLADESVALCPRISVESRIPIEVVLGDVEQSADVRAKVVDALHLEARDLEDDDVEEIVGPIRERLAQVSPDETLLPLASRKRANERRGRAFAVRAPDRDDGGGMRHRADGELDLAPDGHSPSLGHHDLGERRHARRNDHDLGGAKTSPTSTPAASRTPALSSARASADRASYGFASVPDDPRTAAHAKAGRRDAACAEPDDHHTFAG